MEEIGRYVQANLGIWLAGNSLAKPPVVYEIELRERMNLPIRIAQEFFNS